MITARSSYWSFTKTPAQHPMLPPSYTHSTKRSESDEHIDRGFKYSRVAGTVRLRVDVQAHVDISRFSVGPTKRMDVMCTNGGIPRPCSIAFRD